MILSSEWLSRYISLPKNLDTVFEKLTAIGLEVETIRKNSRDVVFEINTPANRSDVLSFIGVARELSVAFLSFRGRSHLWRSPRNLIRLPKIALRETKEPIQKRIKVLLKDPKKCPRYMGRFISNIKMGPSPEWLKHSLESVGQRSINNVVDITNFVMLEYGQPLHAFDADEIEGGEIIVRSAKGGEKIVTLDGIERALTTEDLVIADRRGPVALAGIMGAGGGKSVIPAKAGISAEISDTTKNIFLESAYFDPVTVRKTSKRLGLSSESSKRFERNVDINGVETALDRAASLIASVSGGEALRGKIDHYPGKISPKKISLSLERLHQYLGYEPKFSAVKNILHGLGIVSLSSHSFKIPTHRVDISRDVDLIEEIARFEGYQKIPSKEPAGSPRLEQKIESDRLLEKKIKEALVFCGFTEVIHYSFCSPRDLEKIGWQGRGVRIQNPVGEEMSLLRPTLALSLLKALKFNIDHQTRDVRLFELRSVFDETGREIKMLAGLISGRRYPLHWKFREESVDYFDLKGVTAHLFKTLNLKESYREAASRSYFHPKISTQIWFSLSFPLSSRSAAMHGAALSSRGAAEGSLCLGEMGKIQPAVLEAYDLKQDAYLFELNISEFQKIDFKKVVFQPLSKFPAVKRDLSLLIPLEKEISFHHLVSEMKNAGGALLTRIELFDIYQGTSIPAGTISYTFALTYQSDERTLTDAEVNRCHEGVSAALLKKYDAKIR